MKSSLSSNELCNLDFHDPGFELLLSTLLLMCILKRWISKLIVTVTFPGPLTNMVSAGHSIYVGLYPGDCAQHIHLFWSPIQIFFRMLNILCILYAQFMPERTISAEVLTWECRALFNLYYFFMSRKTSLNILTLDGWKVQWGFQKRHNVHRLSPFGSNGYHIQPVLSWRSLQSPTFVSRVSPTIFLPWNIRKSPVFGSEPGSVMQDLSCY